MNAPRDRDSNLCGGKVNSYRRVTTQTSPRNYPGSCSQRQPKRPKAAYVRSAKFTRRCLWRVGSSLGLKRPHNPKVAGSNPAPATMNDEGLADVETADPFPRTSFSAAPG